jgi:LytS/YehU family sensor histidine kinase
MGPLRFFLPPYILGLCAVALVLVTRRQNRERLSAAELSRAYSAARMAMLSAQLQPHFLFNSLHAISALIDESPRQASTMLARLGDFLRYALENTHWPWVPLESELTGLHAYLELQRTRFADRLNITIDAKEGSLDVFVPSLILQPVVENAIEHGREGGTSMLDVRINTAVVNDRLLVTVTNSRPRLERPLAPADYGQGLTNVALRLHAAYEGGAYLTVGPGAEEGTMATLDMPLRNADELGLSTGDFP